MKSQTIISDFDPNGPLGGLFLPPSFLERIKETRFRQEWKMTLAQYAKMMGRKLPFYQRGGIGQLQSTIGASSAPGGNVTFSSFITVSAQDPGGNNTAGIRWENDGELWHVNSDTGDFQRNGEWWSKEPAIAVGFRFAVRALSGGTGGWTTAAAADNTWITMNNSRTWQVFAASGTVFASDTFEVGPEPSGPADDSGNILCTATDT